MKSFAAAAFVMVAACTLGAPVRAENMITSPRAGSATDGHGLYTLYCASCHGTNLEGSVNAPSIRGVGRAAVDWWVGTGRMPAAVPWEQASRREPLLAPNQIAAVVDYVAGVAPGGPDIPEVGVGGDLRHGRDLFAQNCEHCHGAYGQGNAIGNSYQAPSLLYPTVIQAAEAIRVGPGMMPKFGPDQFSQSDLNDVVRYVDSLRGETQNPGGVQLSATGPFGEGAIAWLVVIVGITGYARLLGRRIAKEDAAVEPRAVD